VVPADGLLVVLHLAGDTDDLVCCAQPAPDERAQAEGEGQRPSTDRDNPHGGHDDRSAMTVPCGWNFAGGRAARWRTRSISDVVDF
jgi:hypothetical protein